MVSTLLLPLTVLGGGNMGSSMVGGLVNSAPPSVAGTGIHDWKQQITVVEPNADTHSRLAEQLEVRVVARCRDLGEEKKGSLLLAVKPQLAEAACRELPPGGRYQLVLSCMAGVSLASLAEWVPGAALYVRFMPNLPAQIGEAVSVYATSNDDALITDTLLKVCIEDLLSSFGTFVHVETEELVDAATAISGSGTGYLAYYLEHMMLVALELGFSDQQAEQLVQQTVKGGVELWKSRGISPTQLRLEVSSSGGTTAAAITKFDELEVGRGLREGVRAAHRRAKELAKSNF